MAKNISEIGDEKIERKSVPVTSLALDPDNPRFFELRELKGVKTLSQSELEKTIIDDDQKFPTLLKAIKQAGVKDPIWVKAQSNGKFLVIEGNLRTCVLRQLLRESVKPPKNVRYDMVMANVYPEDTPDSVLLLQRVRLQSGKNPWGRFNEAATTYKLRREFRMEPDDIATELQISNREVENRLENYRLFLEFSKETKELDPRRFSVIADAPKRVREWIDESDKNKTNFFKLITPQDGITKIRSVTSRGGVRDFAKVLDHPKVLNELVKEPTMTVEDAVNIVQESDLLAELPALKRIGQLANTLLALSEDQVKKLSHDDKTMRSIKLLRNACQGILSKFGANDR